MTKNIFIAVLAIALIAVVGFLIVTMTAGPKGVGVATETPTSTVQNNTDQSSASAPIVTTDQSAVSSNSTVVLTGKVNPRGAQTSYWYQYGITNSFGSGTPPQAIGSGFVEISAPTYITGLNANTLYFYRLVAKNDLGTVTGATYSFSTNGNPPPQGKAPSAQTIAATNLSRTAAKLNGVTNPNGGATTFWFEYGESANLGNITSFQSAGDGNEAVTMSAALSNLKPATQYYFRMNTQNQYGTANGSIMTFTTQGPAAPAGPGAPATVTGSATSIGKTTATLNGHVNPDGATTTYWFEYGKDSLLGNILGSTSKVQTKDAAYLSLAVSAKASNLQSNTKYWYRIVANNAYGTQYGAVTMFQTAK